MICRQRRQINTCSLAAIGAPQPLIRRDVGMVLRAVE